MQLRKKWLSYKIYGALQDMRDIDAIHNQASLFTDFWPKSP